MVVGEVGERADLLVVGAGPGGYAAALNAARLGRKVTLVERSALGGTCLNVGCIPSKTLIEVADLVALPKRAARWGITSTTSTDMTEVRTHLETVVKGLTGGVSQLLDRAGVQLITGTARFSQPNRVAIEEGNNLRHIEFEHVIVATGSRPMELPDLPIDGSHVVGSTELLFRNDIPPELVLVGGGYVGVELGCAYAKLGSRVTIVEAEHRILPGFNSRIGRAVTKGLQKLGVELCHEHTAIGLEERGLRVKGPNGELVLPADVVGVVVGRRPISDSIGLYDIGATVDRQGIVKVDSGRRAVGNVFAIGDITEGPALAHKATAEAEIAANVACGKAGVFDPVCVPMIVFGDPQVVVVGLDEDQAKEKGLEPVSFRFPLAASGRAQTLGGDEGFVNLVADGEGTVIGFQAVGSHVAELAGEATLAIETAIAVEDMAGTIHAHPTLGESILEAALGLTGRPLHVAR